VALGAVVALAGVAESKESIKHRTQGLYLRQISPQERLEQIKAGLVGGQPAAASSLVDQPQQYRLVIPEVARGEEFVIPPKKEPRKETRFIARKPEYTYE
jgi:hypothetical protein